MKKEVAKKGISEGKEIKKITIKKLNDYIEKNIINVNGVKPWPGLICDASYHVTINYNDKKIDIDDDVELYDDLMEIIEKYEDINTTP